MMNASICKTQINYRSGMSFARGITMDLLLDEGETMQLYAKWDNRWGEPLQFQGGSTAIICEMVASVPLQELVSAYGKNLAGKLLEVSQKNSVI